MIIPFDDIGEMFDELERSMKAADANTKEWQKHLTKGDMYCRVSNELGFCIFGIILEDYRQTKPNEIYLQNYRFTWAFSEACPDGELGDEHLVNVTLGIPKELFLFAVNHFGTILPDDVCVLLEDKE